MMTIVAGILVARHLKTAEDLNDSHPQPANGVSDLIRRSVGRSNHEQIDSVFGNSSGDGKRWPRA